jgi:hypothetical protein
MPTMKDELDHVEDLFRLVGYPGCLRSIDCVRIPWRKCAWTLQVQCKNKKKGTPTIVFKVVVSPGEADWGGHFRSRDIATLVAIRRKCTALGAFQYAPRGRVYTNRRLNDSEYRNR